MIIERVINNPYGFIYITTNLINGKRYVGQRKFSSGWASYLGSGKKLRNAIKKYGRKNFSREIIDIGYSLEELNRKEVELIKFLDADKNNNFYNISEGGGIKNKGGKDAYWYNKKLPQDMIDKANLKRYKKVYQYDLKNNFIKEYRSVTDAAKENGLNKQGISISCNDLSKTCGGYFWSYSKDVINRQYDPTKNHKPKKVYQYDYSGEHLLNVYISVKEANKITGIDIGNIYSCCAGKKAHAGKFVWRKE